MGIAPKLLKTYVAKGFLEALLLDDPHEAASSSRALHNMLAQRELHIDN